MIYFKIKKIVGGMFLSLLLINSAMALDPAEPNEAMALTPEMVKSNEFFEKSKVRYGYTASKVNSDKAKTLMFIKAVISKVQNLTSYDLTFRLNSTSYRFLKEAFEHLEQKDGYLHYKTTFLKGNLLGIVISTDGSGTAMNTAGFLSLQKYRIEKIPSMIRKTRSDNGIITFVLQVEAVKKGTVKVEGEKQKDIYGKEMTLEDAEYGEEIDEFLTEAVIDIRQEFGVIEKDLVILQAEEEGSEAQREGLIDINKRLGKVVDKVRLAGDEFRTNVNLLKPKTAEERERVAELVKRGDKLKRRYDKMLESFLTNKGKIKSEVPAAPKALIEPQPAPILVN